MTQPTEGLGQVVPRLAIAIAMARRISRMSPVLNIGLGALWQGLGAGLIEIAR